MKDYQGNELPIPSQHSTWMGLGISFFLMWALTMLKLVGWIDWSWWIILAPVLIPCAFFTLAGIFAAVAVIFFGVGKNINND